MADVQILGSGDCDDGKGKKGKRGRRGPAGPAGGLLKFFGASATSPDGAVETFLLDQEDAVTVAPAYPLAVVRLARNLAVNLAITGLSPVPVSGATVVIQLVKNGVAVSGFAITYDASAGESGVKTLSAGPTTFAIGDTLDLRVTTDGFGDNAFTVTVSATVGVEGDD